MRDIGERFYVFYFAPGRFGRGEEVFWLDLMYIIMLAQLQESGGELVVPIAFVLG